MTIGATESGWHVALRTDAGPREANEDSVLSMRLGNGGHVIALADGMGGLEMGDVASRTALEALKSAMVRGGTLQDAVQAANRAVFERAAGRKMGTTLVVAHAVGHRVTVANVGDSRAYRCTSLGIRRISIDHTHAEEARLSGAVGDIDAVAGRWANALTRSLGARPDVEVDLFGPFDVDDGESILLCSDGVHGVLPDTRIEAWSQSVRDPEAAVQNLVNLALGAGSQDNTSAVILHRPSATFGLQPAALRRRVPNWNPKTLMERSPVPPRQKHWGRVLSTLVALAGLAVAAAAWLVMR